MAVREITTVETTKSARRRFLSFLGGAATLSLTPAAIATAKPAPDDAEFLHLYRTFEETKSLSDLSNYQEICALRDKAVHIMARMPVHTLAGVECKVRLLADWIGRLMPSHDIAVWADGAWSDIRGMSQAGRSPA